MNIIAIQSNRELAFDPVTRATGIVTVNIVTHTKDIETGNWELKIKDVCVESIPTGEFDENEEEIIEYKTHEKYRLSKLTDEQMNQLSYGVQLPPPNPQELAEYVDEVFRQGLLLKTQMECLEGKGIYFSEAEDWMVVEDEKTAERKKQHQANRNVQPL